MYQLPVVVSRDNHTGLGGWLALGDCIGQCHIFGFTTYKIQVHQANTTLLLQSSSDSVTGFARLCITGQQQLQEKDNSTYTLA